MHKIAKEAEAAVYHKQLFEDLRMLTPRPTDITHTTALAAVEAAINCLAVAIVTVTSSGRSAMLMSAYRPRCPILAVTRNDRVISGILRSNGGCGLMKLNSCFKFFWIALMDSIDVSIWEFFLSKVSKHWIYRLVHCVESSSAP